MGRGWLAKAGNAWQWLDFAAARIENGGLKKVYQRNWDGLVPEYRNLFRNPRSSIRRA